MEQVLYQRPREKLRNRGVKALTDVELLQTIIGSGTQKVSAARIAKNVKSLIDESSQLLLDDLLEIKGVGVAKAAQIVAAVELGRRIYGRRDVTDSDIYRCISLPKESKRSVEYSTINGAGEIISTRMHAIETSQNAVTSIRKMFADCLHDHASSLMVGIGAKTYDIDSIDDALLEITKTIFETAHLLEIKIQSIWLVNQTSQRQLSRKNIQ